MRKPAFTTVLCLCFLTSAQAAGVSFFCSDTLGRELPAVEVKADARKMRTTTPYQKIDAAQIKAAGMTDISDAVRRLPGANLRDYGGAGGLKTVSVRGMGAQHTTVVYDGVALSDCQSGQIDLSRYSLDNVSSLTLFAGDNDDIFIPAKSTATASSLQISSFTMPAPGDSALHLKASMKAGSWGQYNPYARVSKSLSDRFAFSASADYRHGRNDYPFTVSNGDATTRARRENSLMNCWTGEINGAWKIAHDKALSAKLYYYDNNRALPGPVIYYVSETHEHLRERNLFYQMQFRGRIARQLSLSAIGKYSWSASRYTDTDGKYPGGKLDNYHLQRESYASAALLYTPLRNLSLDYSADWAFNNLSSNTRTAIRPYRHSIYQTIAAKWSDRRLTVVARGLLSVFCNGAKDGEAGKNYRRLSPMASVSFRVMPDEELYLRASYKNIFRLPTFNEAYFDNYGSINLEPEKTDQTGFGFSYSPRPGKWLSNLTLTCDGYVNNIRNRIVAVPYNMHIWHMTNLGRVRTFGVDAMMTSTFELAPRHSLLLNLTYSYQRAQIRTSREASDWMKQVAYLPLNSGSASLTWMNPWVDVAVRTIASGSRYTTNYNLPETRIKGYTDTAVTLTSRKLPAGKGYFRASFSLMNIFDSQYEIVARYPMPGRAWSFNIEYNL